MEESGNNLEGESLASEQRENCDVTLFEEEFEVLRQMVGDIDSQATERTVLSRDALEYLNLARVPDGNNLLMQSVRLGRLEAVKFCLMLDGIKLNERNLQYKNAADMAWEQRDYLCLLELLRADSEFPSSYSSEEVDLDAPGGEKLLHFAAKRDRLHHLIEEGDLESIKKMAESEKSSIFLSTDNVTAISRAIKNNRFEIYGYLVFIGAELTDEDKYDLSEQEEDAERFYSSLEEYFFKDENSYFIKLVVSSKILGIFSETRKYTINRLFNRLNNIAFTRSIMKVLEHQDIEVIFDFNSKTLERACGLKNDMDFGLTLPSKRRVYIGAKKSDSDDSAFIHVAGTLAHELGHMAMEALYRNDAKPYRKDDVDRETQFLQILEDVRKAVKGSKGVIHELIGTLFENYPHFKWSCELIVRVPHILGKVGEIEGKKTLDEAVPKLLEFYSNYVFHKCEEYSDPSYFTRPLCSIESLVQYRGILQEKDRYVYTFKENMWSFRDCIVRHENVCLIFTSNTKLCTLHLYYELSRGHDIHTEKQCLFLDSDCFFEFSDSVINAFRCKACRYLVVVTKKGDPGYSYFLEWIEEIPGFEKKELFLIVDEKCNDLENNQNRKVLHYNWNDLSSRSQERLLNKYVYFQGKYSPLTTLIEKGTESDVMKSEGISYLMENENVDIGDDRHLTSFGYDKKLFIQRAFFRYNAQKIVQNVRKKDYYLFITGLPRDDLKNWGIDDETVQEVQLDEILDTEKLIVMPKREEDSEQVFKENFRNFPLKKNAHWVHFCRGNFYWRTSIRQGKESDVYLEEESISEYDLIFSAESNKDRAILISDIPGSGKTTVVTDMIREAKRRWPKVFVWRMNFNDYANSKEINPLSLNEINEENIFEWFIKILSFKHSLELSLVKSYLNIPLRCMIFCDGFDVTVPQYKDKAIMLLLYLMEHTRVLLCVTTRSHERLTLETVLNTVSYSLKDISSAEKFRFLSEFWKRELKKIVITNLSKKIQVITEEVKKRAGDDLVRSLEKLSDLVDKAKGEDGEKMLTNLSREIEKLNFESYAEEVLKDVTSVIVDNEKPFTGVPLHLVMLADLMYQEDLRLQTQTEIFNFYSHFVDKKIDIFIKDKCEMVKDNQGLINVYESLKRNFIEAHLKISDCVFNPELFPWDSLEIDELKSYIHDVGLINKSGERFEFVHMTFAEFFFSQRILRKVKSKEIDEEMLEILFLEPKYSVVLKFLDGAFQKEDVKNYLKAVIVERWNVTAILKKCIRKVEYGDLSGKYVLRAILDKCSALEKDLISETIRSLRESSMEPGTIFIFHLLAFCLRDKILLQIFDEHIENTFTFVCDLFIYSSADEVMVVLNVLRRLFGLKNSLFSASSTAAAYSLENRQDGKGFLMATAGSGEEKRLKVFDAKGRFGRNILLSAAKNEDANVLLYLLRFSKELQGEERTRNLLLERDDYNGNILNWIGEFTKHGLPAAVREIGSIVDKNSFIQMMIEGRSGHLVFLLEAVFVCDEVLGNIIADTEGLNLNFLHQITFKCPFNEFEELLEYVISVCGGKLPDRKSFVADERGLSLWHRAAYEIKDFGSAIPNVVILWNHLETEEELEESVMRADYEGNTIFHKRAEAKNPLSDLFALEQLVMEETLIKLLTTANSSKETCLHALFRYSSSSRSLLSELNFISRILKEDHFVNFLMAKTKFGETVLHYAAQNRCVYYDFGEIFNLLNEVLKGPNLQNLMEQRSSLGETVKITELENSVKLELCIGSDNTFPWFKLNLPSL